MCEKGMDSRKHIEKHHCSSTMAASGVQEQDLIVLGRRPQGSRQPQQQSASSAADSQQARMQAAMRTRPDGSLENVQASSLMRWLRMSSHGHSKESFCHATC